MNRQHSLITLSNEQTIAWYQHHVYVLHGYALALAFKAGLSPAEAAAVFVEPWHDGGSVPLPVQVTPQILEQQARQIAEVFALTHGEEQVQVACQDETWSIEVTVSDCEPFERYGASLEMHTQWIAEQLRHVCEPKGILCSVQMDSERVSLHLSLQK